MTTLYAVEIIREFGEDVTRIISARTSKDATRLARCAFADALEIRIIGSRRFLPGQEA